MKGTLFLILACLILCGCEKDDCKSIRAVQIDEAIIPDTVTIDGPIQIAVKAAATNLCWSDLYVELKEKQQFEYFLKSYGTVTCCEDGCVCPASMLYKDTTLAFQPSQRGMYLFHISETSDRVVVDTMIVN
jgi:hypothetical protein